LTIYLNYELFVFSVSKAARQKEYDAFRNNKKSKQSHSSPWSPPRVVQRPVLATVALTPSILLSSLLPPSFVSPQPLVGSSTVVDSSFFQPPVSSPTGFVPSCANSLLINNENTPPPLNYSAEVSNIFSIEGLLVAIRDVLSEDGNFIQSSSKQQQCI